MRPIKIGDSGRGVEDIQRRLQRLGYDLGAGGVDGDFREETRAAVEAFQIAMGLTQTGKVGSHTWSALVDSTFVFGDRSLYLRKPHFHGQDVVKLQQALTALGFFGGQLDGIFGPHTERAVIDFQTNMDISPDGAAGQLTYEALAGLKHIWDNRDAHAHSEAIATTLNREPVLSAYSWCFVATDPLTRQIVRRLVNLAIASAEGADISHCNVDDARGAFSLDALSPDTMRVAIAQPATIGVLDEEMSRVTIAYEAQRDSLQRAWLAATAHDPASCRAVTIVMEPATLEATNKLHFQFTAAVILDTLCAVFDL
jgi:peptidoglycan hydrolase-like protein with peptidoglycan-binding domain